MLSNRRYHAVAQKLDILPPEVLHKVLDDLPLLKILEVISVHNVPYVDSCVLSHPNYGRIFRTPQSLFILKQYFTLYVELCQRQQGPRSSGNPEIARLARNATQLVKELGKAPGYSDKILAEVKVEVFALLETYKPYMQALAQYSPQSIAGGMPDLSDPVALRHFWTHLDAAETSLNEAKSAQLLRIARLYAEYPGMLRHRLDDSQESRRLSDHHRIDALKISAQRMLKPQILRGKFVAKAIFSQQQFPVIPYDRHLKTFLKVIAKFPLDGPHPLADSAGRRTKAYTWPSEVICDIRNVLEGLAYVYPKATIEGVHIPTTLRTKHTRYSDAAYSASAGNNQPCFMGGFDDHSKKPKHLLYHLDNDRILPLEKREFAWLEAFLRACQYMREMDDAEWRAGMTVKQFWSIHTGDVPSNLELPKYAQW
ncbi:hypothetical protein DXG01_009517 [Tephrocybe rancida]|nr:hypothetical protein DXG01_009517 [Tephrocybe rancida]